MASPYVQESDIFLKHVRRVREEIERKFARAHQLLVERETELISKLDQLEARYRGDDIIERIDGLNNLITQFSNLKLNPDKDLVVKEVAMLNDRVRTIMEDWEMEKASMKRVELEWDAQLESRLIVLGAIRVSNFPDYKETGNPIIVAGKHSYEKSTSAGVFCNPRSIAIHPKTNNIYVCDHGNNRIQVFTEYLEFLLAFSSEKMSFPDGMCISNNSVYVTQYGGHCLSEYTAEGEFLKSVGIYGKKKPEFAFPRGVAASEKKKKIYVCDSENNRIQCLNLNLTFNSIISSIPHPIDIKTTAEWIVVLTRGEHWICYYNYAHQLIRKVIQRAEDRNVTQLCHFCLDAKQNILITDSTANCVIIFSSNGELIRKFGKYGTGKGVLFTPTGIAIDSENRIIVASQNPNFCLQFF